MGLIDIIKEKMFKPHEKEIIDDNETKDNHLRSLRRERRIQNEEVEKERLIKTIAAYKKQRMAKHLWGIKNNLQQLKKMKVKKVGNILKDQTVDIIHSPNYFNKKQKGGLL